MTHPGQIHVEMDVPAALYNYVIGARGSEIKHIQNNFKVSVHIPNADTVAKNVLVVGDPVGVKGAEKYIQKIIDQALADKAAAEKMNDAWVDTEVPESVHEEWMDAYAHPSRSIINGDNSNLTALSNGLMSVELGSGSSAVVSATASAWGASVLASSDGW